ncbi:hypothetical protein PQ462_09810 [Flavobacterium sp. KACC 22758]|uniref:hypothetical protein n=1 Tax=Flavobacterium sp. KACC 22758 TaxID=3025667 RepID=UPI002365DEF9|nr:hypothetical protein [Flavobacterium sp. KACC 22758]WDF61667.1 hypothetical protein PQ462_09810 [Flavobacterium sp. KACC 22758]
MAIYGVGAYYDKDVSGDFISQNLVGVGWDDKDAPELKEYFTSLKTGDIVYIKATFGQNDITVKAIGVIKDNIIIRNNGLVSTGRNVKWISTDKFIIARPKEKNNVRANTVYEEFHPEVLDQIISRIN